jgi:hypothetical protein
MNATAFVAGYGAIPTLPLNPLGAGFPAGLGG